MKSHVAVVIPSWNGADFISDCLKSLQKQTLKPRIVIVENGSTDNSLEVIKKVCPEAEVLKFKDNAGFAGGVNRGINKLLAEKKDRVKYIALFNNDAQADKNWLHNLVAAAVGHPDAGIITCKFLRIDKTHIDTTGDQYATHAMPFPRGRNQVDKGQYDKGEYVFGATGGASLYNVEMLEKIGLFDEDFFAYYEDVDISFRAQLSGYKVWYEPTAEAYHQVSATSSKMDINKKNSVKKSKSKISDFSRYHSTKNFIYLYNKNMPGILFWRYKFWFFERLARMLVGSIINGQLKPYMKGFFEALLKSPKTLSKRYKIQKNREVSTAYINSILYKGKPPKIPNL